MMKSISISIALAVLTLTGCTAHETVTSTSTWVDLSEKTKPEAITQMPWTEVVIGVQGFDDVPRLFTEIAEFETIMRNDTEWVLRARGADGGSVRFKRVDENAIPTRPFGSRSWDTGCFFSVMMRAKNLPSIIEDAKAIGWAPLTEMAYLEFGPSKLNIVVLGHEKTGIQVQLYERLTTPLPEGFTPFERLSRPFNMMQMVEDRDAAYTFYRQGLGFDNFYFGKPSISETPEINPLGIPKDLTTKIAYHAGITTPKSGLEWGRMEMIQVDMEKGKDLSDRCLRSNIGITEVRFGVDSLQEAEANLKGRKISYQRDDLALRIKTPDGANITFTATGGTK